MPPKKKAPISKFKSGGAQFGSPFKGGRKDDRHVLMYQGVQQGLMVAYLKKANADAEPFLLHDYSLFRENPAIMERLGINAILSRKGDDGEPLMQSSTSTYHWKQFVFIIGENTNTPATRKELAEALVSHFNTQATTTNYQYPKRVKLGDDLTARPLSSVDAVLLDQDVISMMSAAYDISFEELSTYDPIMRSFWSDIAHGREVVAAHQSAIDNAENEAPNNVGDEDEEFHDGLEDTDNEED
jgi:hypothetical protein